MLCDNCGKKEANVKYSEKSNGVKENLIYVRNVVEN